MCPSTDLLYFPPFQEGRGPGGWSKHPLRRKSHTGSAEGRSPSARGLSRCPPALASGESRGVQPLWQAVWRMCLHQLIFFTFPLPGRKGARGMVQAPFEATPHTGSAEGRSPSARGLSRCPPALASGESRGVQPLWQEVWRMCLHQLIFFTFPLPGRKGARGMVQAPFEAKVRTRGVQRGVVPLPGV